MSGLEAGRMYIAPAGHRGTNLAEGWTEIGAVEDVDFCGPATTRSWLDEHLYAIPGHTVHMTFHHRFRNTLEFRNFWRLMTGTSQGLPSLIHNGKKPRK